MVKAVILYTLLLFSGLFFQGAVVSSTLPSAIVPDILVVLNVYISLRYRTVRGLLGVFCLGLLADMASAVYVGPNAAGAVVVFTAAGLLANRVYAERVFAMVVISFVCSILKSLTIASLLLYYTSYNIVFASFLRTVFFEAAATAFVAPIIIRLLQLGSPSSKGRAVTTRSNRATAAWGTSGR